MRRVVENDGVIGGKISRRERIQILTCVRAVCAGDFAEAPESFVAEWDGGVHVALGAIENQHAAGTGGLRARMQRDRGSYGLLFGGAQLLEAMPGLGACRAGQQARDQEREQCDPGLHGSSCL